MKWWCCEKTRHDNFCPICGVGKWNVVDLGAAEKLVDALVRRTISFKSSENHEESVLFWTAEIEENVARGGFDGWCIPATNEYEHEIGTKYMMMKKKQAKSMSRVLLESAIRLDSLAQDLCEHLLLEFPEI